MFEGINVPVNGSHGVSMNRTVSVGNFTIMAVIDPEGSVPEDEDNKRDNIVSRVMSVLPTRDFTVTNVTAAKTDLSDLDTTNITAGVANIGLKKRNGTTRVDFVDHENETRIYNYYFDKSLPLSYLPISPDATLSGPSSPYSDLTIVHRPGADAIQLHFDRISLYIPTPAIPYAGLIWVSDEICSDYKEGLWMDSDEITYAINGAVFEVNRELGAGFLEKVYENALLIEFRKKCHRCFAIVALNRYVGYDRIVLWLRLSILTISSLKRSLHAQIRQRNFF